MTDQLEYIKQNVLITDLLTGAGIQVNRSGFIKSPYKDEKTPSCKIYEDNNTYYDFSMNQGGSVIDFYMAYYSVDLETAIKELKIFAGMTDENAIERKPTVKPVVNSHPLEAMSEEERELYFERAAIACEDEALKQVQLHRLQMNKQIFTELHKYCNNLGWDAAALSYLTHKRKLSRDIINRFGLFCIKDYYQVNNHLKKVFKLADLQRSGLYNLKEDGTGNMIFYQHKIIIPYYFNNEIVYLRGRYFDNTPTVPTGSMKYLGLRNDALNLNSPKRFYNYKKLSAGEKVYLVEGEFDAMAVEMVGFNCIAIPGAGNMPSKEKFLRIKDYKVVFMGDNDEAGQRMLTGFYLDPRGEKRYTDNNLSAVFKWLNKTLYKKVIPAKDFNDFLVLHNIEK